jgi:glutathione-regulated potassium-efflux system protein KefB
MSFLQQALVYLAAAVVAVPLFKRLGLGSVLGYLAAGVVIGPWAIGLIADVESVLHVAELGVVLLLFIVGLELQPSRLWQLRRTVFGLGSAQVLATAAVLAGVALLVGQRGWAALVIGVGLSLSSTAFALQLLAEKKELEREHGRAAFGILLFQDLAVIPLLAILPLVGAAPSDGPGDPLWLSAAKVIGVLAGVFAGGRYVLRPVFRQVARTQSQEVMTAAALLVAVGTALLVGAVGLSMSLGAFLAGVMLAESEYRHELEADIEPFKGLLLGLFFIAVGMSADLGIVLERPFAVAGLVLGMTAVKLAVLYLIGRRALGGDEPAVSLAVVLSQGGEFAFVLFGLAARQGIMDRALADLLVVVVSASMALTPLLFGALTRVVRPRLLRRQNRASRPYDEIPDEGNRVIIAGFGRVGQVVARVLRARRIGFTALDTNPDHIEFVKRFGNRVFYGDAGRLDLLRAAGADRASIFVLAIDDIESSLRIAAFVREEFPHLTIFARARNRQHAYKLLELGIDHLVRDTFPAALELTRDVLTVLGTPLSVSRQLVDRFREHDEELLVEAYQHRADLGKLTEIAMRGRAELEKLFQEDDELRESLARSGAGAADRR